LSWAFVDTSAVSGTAEIVHHDLCAFGGEHQRVVAPDSPTSACNDAHSAFTQSCHDDVSLVSPDLRIRLCHGLFRAAEAGNLLAGAIALLSTDTAPKGSRTASEATVTSIP
jgi:hypothetical protein